MKFVARDIAVDRGLRRIVENISFSLGDGDAMLVTGTNGAGKSTLLRALCGLLPLAGGALSLQDIGDGETDPFIIREYIHFLGPANAMKPSLTVTENLDFWQKFSTAANRGGEMPIAEALDLVDLTHAADLPYSYLSTGMKRRAAIARLLITDRPIWIVDEPTSGLDAQSTAMFSSLCRDFCADGGILIAATHLPLDIDNAQQLAIEPISQSVTHHADPWTETASPGVAQANDREDAG